MVRVAPLAQSFKLSVLLAVGGTVALLQASGRLWWCVCATPRVWIGDVNSSHLSQHLLDPYSLSHLLHGVLFFAALQLCFPRSALPFRFVLAVMLECGWELLENSSFIIDRYRQSTMALNYYGDSIVNSVGDILNCMLGFFIAQSVRWYMSVALFLMVELGMLYIYRDNLTLNVLMLTYPSESVKRWQMEMSPTTPNNERLDASPTHPAPSG